MATGILEHNPPKSETAAAHWWRILTAEWLIFALIMLVAIFFRFYQITAIPAEFNFDEWADSFDALDMIQHGPKIYSPMNNGREMLFAFLVSLGFRLVGPQDVVLRLIAAAAGTLAIAAGYLLTREMFRPLAPARARWIAALTSLGMAVSFWELLHIRMGRRHTLLPLLLSLTFYFLWRGFNTGRRWWFVLSGAVLGLSLYTYPSARFAPVVIVFFFAVQAAVQWRQKPPSLLRRYWQEFALLVLASVVVFAPLGYYFLVVAPEQFFYRVNQISVFNTDSTAEQPPAASLGQSVAGNLLGLVWRGEEDSLYNIPGRPMFGPLMFAAFVLGVGVSLARFRRPPYLFVLVWFVVMMLPAFFVTDRIPAFKRAIGIIP
ncbi:MAG: hypothetical protein D6768_09665, partial [Chloroflexi bacterium]